MDAGVAAVSPGDGDFFDFEAELAGEEKNFRIESPALDLLTREDRIDGGALEGFESALCVGVVEAERETEKEIEDASDDLAVKWLALGLRFGAQPARADSDVGTDIERMKKLGRFFDRRRQIGVAKEDDSSAGIEHAVAHAVPFAAIAGILDEADDSIFRGEGADNISGVVAGSVIDDDDFGVPVLRVDVGENLCERRAEASAFVVGGNDDGVSGGQNSFSVLDSQYPYSVLSTQI